MINYNHCLNRREKVRSTAVQQWIVICRSLNDYKNKTFKDSVFDLDDEDADQEYNTNCSKNIKLCKKAFGNMGPCSWA